jgi:hypothetical protein
MRAELRVFPRTGRVFTAPICPRAGGSFALHQAARRMARGCFLAAALFVLGCTAPGPSEEETKAYTWFDGLGLPDLTKAKYVKVSTGSWHGDDGRAPESVYFQAFLLEDEGPSFRVLTSDLCTRTFKKTGKDVPKHKQIAYEVLDLEKAVGRRLDDVKNAKEDEARWRCFGEQRSSDGFELFVLARVCALQGHSEQARQSVEQAKKLLTERRDWEQPKSFHQQLADEMAHLLLWRAVEAFGDPAISRQELLTRIERIVEDFPESEKAKGGDEDESVSWLVGRHGKMAKEYAGLLKTMVAEDEAHARKPAEREQEMSKQEGIAELIFRLRDQNGRQWFQPGSCDIFATELAFNNEEGESPAHQLVKIGYDAVPLLIDALEDQRLTRSVDFRRDFYFSHLVLRVSDCAYAIIERISGRRFLQPTQANAPMTRDQLVTVTKKKIEAWWAELQKKGEKRMLIEATEAGDEESLAQARMLVKRHPEAALDALIQGADNCTQSSIHARLLDIVATVKGDQALKFLRKELNGPTLCSRVAAARGLQAHGHDDGVPPMIEAWHKLLTTTERPEGTEALIRFLASSDRPEAIQALGVNLRKRPLAERVDVMEALMRWPKDEDHPLPATITAARDEALVLALGDPEEYLGMGAGWGDVSFNDPRMCDLAGYFLRRLWNLPDRFDPSASLHTRDRQRVELENIWRKKLGLLPLPLPVFKKIERRPEHEIKPMLDAILTAAGAKERQEAIQAVGALGLPALPAVKELLATTKADHSAHADLEQLAARLACTVDEIAWAENSAKPTKELQQRLDVLKGKPLRANALVDLLLAVPRSRPEGVAGIEIALEREGDDTGITLTVRLLSQPISTGDLQKGWCTHESFRADGFRTRNTSGRTSYEHGLLSEDAWKSFRDSLTEALGSSPDKYVSARMSIVRER